MAEAVTSKTWSHPRHPKIWANTSLSPSAPCALIGTLPAEILARRFRAGENVFELANDYDVPCEAIEAALRFALDQSAMRAWRKWRRDVSK